MDSINLRDYPLESILNIIYGKWKFHIICSLLQRPKHFGELQRSIGNVSKKVLRESSLDGERRIAAPDYSAQ